MRKEPFHGFLRAASILLFGFQKNKKKNFEKSLRASF